MFDSKGLVALAVSAVLLGGCVMAQTTSFRAGPSQALLVRDGRPMLQSVRAKTEILVMPLARQMAVTERPNLLLSIRNVSKQPVTFQLGAVTATQIGGKDDGKELKVYSYEELMVELRNRRVTEAVLVGLVAGANSYGASRSSRNPYVRAWNQQIAAQQNADLAASVANQNEVDAATLESIAIKDNTLLPGESYGGLIVIDAPTRDEVGRPTAFRLSVPIAGERHDFDGILTPIGQ